VTPESKSDGKLYWRGRNSSKGRTLRKNIQELRGGRGRVVLAILYKEVTRPYLGKRGSINCRSPDRISQRQGNTKKKEIARCKRVRLDNRTEKTHAPPLGAKGGEVGAIGEKGGDDRGGRRGEGEGPGVQSKERLSRVKEKGHSNQGRFIR